MSDRNLRLQVILSAVDKLTRPFKGAQATNKRLAETIKQSRQQLRELNQQAGKIDGFRKTKQALGSTEHAYRSATERVATLSRALNASASPTQTQIRQLQQAKNAARQLKDKTHSLSQSLQRQRDALHASGISTHRLGEAQRRINGDISRTTGALERQQQQLERLRQQEQRMAAAKSRYQKMKDVRNQVATTGAAATAAGVGALYSAKRVMMPGYDFEVGMSNVQALTRLDKNSPQLKALREQARQLGATTSFTANDVAGGMGFLAMAGYDPDKIQKSIPAMLDLAKAAGMDDSLAEVADIASNIQSAYKIPADEMKRVADILTYGFTTSNTDLRMLGETMKYVGPAAQSAAQDFESVVAAVGLLGNVGIQGSQAGTSLRMALLRLAAQPSAAKKALNELNVSIADSSGKMRAMPEILSDLESAFKKQGIGGVGNAKKIAFVKDIFGVEASSAMLELLDKQGSIDPEKRIDAYIKKIHEQDDTARQVAKAKADNMDGDIKNLRSAWEDIGITLYDSVKEPLRDIFQKATDIMRSIGKWAKANPELTKKITMIAIGLGVILAVFGAITLALAALLGPLAMVKFSLSVLGIKGAGSILKLGSAFSAVGKVLSWLRVLVLTNPLLLIIGLIALGAYLIWKNWDKLGPWFKKLWDNISNYVSTAWASIKQKIVSKWGEIKADILARWDTIKTYISNKWDEIVENAKKLPGRFKKFGREIIDKLVTGIKEKWAALKQSLSELGTQIKEAVTPDFMKEQAQQPEVKQALEAYNSATRPHANPFGFAGAHDTGGYIPAGKFGLVGEYGPELINGPTHVTSRRQTAALARIAATALSMGAVSAVGAQSTPLHPYSLPAAHYQTTGVAVINQHQRNDRPAYEIHIHATPAQSAQDIAQAVARELDRREQQQRARARSVFSDREDFY
ncbi:phage tail tape measure protein [Xenorhabdus eapokensis]|uniref:Phage tail tape measure protein n=1 Tax=Xenorhabdus eapokensis TaxID=1873482 RepID=A0A1Q5TUM0_9GAMM|nr:phage tail tape measure protein [Xenorhabdus eapokensis]OKP03938.1 phage tail tape measure protein [Xenorhabdus eapokensis]